MGLVRDAPGLSPFLIQAGSREFLTNDAIRFAQRLDQAGVANWLQIWDRAPHVFQLTADVKPDARQALSDIATFIRYVTTHDV